MHTFHTDLARFTTAGYGTLRGAGVENLEPGSMVAVTDDEADAFEAEVLSVRDGTAEVRICWDRSVHRV